MKEQLRKVTFNLDEQNSTFGDLNFQDTENITIDRHGYFHTWGNVEFYDSEEERFKLKTVAIVEESKTGKVFEVAPKCILFEKPL